MEEAVYIARMKLVIIPGIHTLIYGYTITGRSEDTHTFYVHAWYAKTRGIIMEYAARRPIG